MKKILLAVDSSKKSEKAAKKIEQLVISPDTEITILHVVTPVNLIHDPQFKVEELLEERKDELKKQGKKVLNTTESLLNKVLKKDNVSIKKLLKIGKPAECICNIADKKEHDLLIISEKGKNKDQRFQLGSTADKVVRHAKTPVLILKKDKCL